MLTRAQRARKEKLESVLSCLNEAEEAYEKQAGNLQELAEYLVAKKETNDRGLAEVRAVKACLKAEEERFVYGR